MLQVNDIFVIFTILRMCLFFALTHYFADLLFHCIGTLMPAVKVLTRDRTRTKLLT